MRWAFAGLAFAVCVGAASSAHAGGERWIASISSATVRAPGPTGELDHFGSGGALTLTWLERCRDERLCGALESSALFIAGEDGARLYDLSLSLIGSMPLNDDDPLAPYLGIGFDFAATTFPEPGGKTTRGVGLGVHGNIGLHALLGEKLYARGQVGYVGAGIGGVKGELAIGYSLD